MKPLLVLFLFLSFAAFGQANPADSSFTDKRLARNRTFNGLKEGRWLEYEHLIQTAAGTTDSTKAFYLLTFYKSGKPIGMQREYFNKNGLLRSEIMYTPNGGKVEKDYYSNGNEPPKSKPSHPSYNY